MIPIPSKEGVTIPIAVLSEALQSLLGASIPSIMVIIILLAFVGTVLAKTMKPAMITKSPFLTALFDIPLIWVIARILAVIFSIMIYFKVGPEAIWSENTGAILLFDLLPVLFSVFLFAGLLLPLLLNFGLLELFGALLTKFMRPVFKLPGRSSIDALASWLGDGTIGVLLTSRQYEDGYYTKREAAIVGTTFSVVSITFSIVVIKQVGLMNYFVPYYFAVTFSGLIAAFILPRIWPLSTKPDTFINEKEDDQTSEIIPEGYSRFGYGLEQAQLQARKSKSISKFLLDGSKNILDMWLGVAPIVMALGTVALVIAEYTPLFQWLGVPFIPLLELLRVPEAQAASQTLVVGFADMFLPSILAEGIESDMTRFIVASVSVTQLIYMSEVGGVLLGSKIPVGMKDLIILFILRTLITLPIITLIAHLIF
ncbi:YjiH family protein [Lederbergia citrea]|uniref:YjiH family protein n=1 Tax=Lederbergia citrea TaxID=2833581 RepID=A0A942Z4C8_9BACI|nr:YjiH family protein [Lederbergia citrea]MBS4204639.1 YjiH family protein [Lederbergia citrea]MBS4223514.1 YjiH family protein [Lederbergia citrea]